MRLYTTPQSANGRKPLAMCRAVGIDVTVEHVNVYRGEGRSPTYLAINPAGKIPTLVDGATTIWESNAILIYLAERSDGRLWGRDPARRADIARWLFWEAAEWQPALVPVLKDVVAQALGLTPPVPRAIAAWQDARACAAAGLLDAHLAGRAFLCGELTLADLSVAGMMTYARAAAFPFGRFPHIAVWYERIEALPAWQATAVAPWA
jgi:glutathione S-transferase